MRSNSSSSTRSWLGCLSYLPPLGEPSRTNAVCALAGVPLSRGCRPVRPVRSERPQAPRYRCGGCKRRFSGRGKSTKRQRMAHKNRDIFSLLINKMPLRLSPPSPVGPADGFYDKIGFIYRQCQAFAGRERQLPEMKPKLYLDRPADPAVNWNWLRRDRRNITLQAIATADLTSGFVFGMDLNFDPSLDLDRRRRGRQAGRPRRSPQPYRRFARLWHRTTTKRSRRSPSAAKTRSRAPMCRTPWAPPSR